MRTGVVVLTGIDPDALAATIIGLQFDLPGAVAVRHTIDVHRSVLTRVVSDITGVLERVEIDMEHACVSCAIREDVVPTLERLARSDRWQSIICQLPVGAEARQVCNVLTWETRLARHLRINAVVTALDGPGVVDDLLGEDLLVERGRHSSDDDRRGVGEVASALVEYADVVVTHDATTATGVELAAALARPGTPILEGVENLEAATLASPLYDQRASQDWTSPTWGDELVSTPRQHVWQADLTSSLPFHPDRLLDELETLGGGRRRSRGCFWLPTRPDRIVVWDGAGGQLSIGNGELWGARTPMTRLVLTGTGTRPDGLLASFESMLLSPDEAAARGSWRGSEDGFEPWLGPARRIA